MNKSLFYAAMVLLLTFPGNAEEIPTSVGDPGETYFFEKTISKHFEKTTFVASAIKSPYHIQLPDGRTAILSLANPDSEPLVLHLQGSEPAEVTLAPGAWTSFEAKIHSAKLRLDWTGPRLFLAQPYLKPRLEKLPSNILLISIDTLRYDFFSPKHMPETFTIFREEGVIFRRIYTATPWTLPAHASLFSGSYPTQHGLRQLNNKLPASILTFSEVLQQNGYYTSAVTEGWFTGFHLHQGFHSFYENPPAMASSSPDEGSRIKTTLEILRAEIARLYDVPKFLFFHTYEVHCPYLPRNGLLDKEGIGNTGWLLRHDWKPVEPHLYRKLESLYREEVAYTDQLLAPLIEELLEDGSWIVALVSDHGEEFGEHGGLLHAKTAYEELTHIPFAIAGHQGPGGYREILSSIIDVPATLLGTLSITPPEQWQSRDLLAVTAVERPVFSESYYFGRHIPTEDPSLLAVWQAHDKLIHTKNFDEETTELYDLRTDAEERNGLLDEKAAQDSGLLLLMEAYRSETGLASESIDGLTREQLDALRSLGYIE